ncbi:unnamed protein product, partial [Mesorhabditis belari]|uniref:Uncharacterized protein n=1 Tax=Mesorhabditis belari TaxID=2138241 RepID=A0AAF3E8H8_9BILA
MLCHLKEILKIDSNQDVSTKTAISSRLFADDGCYLLKRDLTDPTEKQFDEFHFLVKWIAFTINPKDSPISLKLKKIWHIFLSIICIYTTLYDLYILITQYNSSHAPHVIIYLMIAWQSLFSLFLLVNWQHKLRFESFFHLYHHSKIRDVPELDERHLAAVRRTRRQFWGMQLYSVVNMSVYLIAIMTKYIETIMNPAYAYSFYFPILRYIRPVLGYMCLLVLTHNMHIYLSITNLLHSEVRKFNYTIKNLKASTSDEMKSRLESLLCLHTKICGLVTEMDEIYRIYTFMTTICTIPLMIFALVISRKTLIEFSFSVSPMTFCAYQLYVIMYPARLHGELNKSKYLLCMNEKVWIPYDENVHKIGTTLAIHLDQPSVGITLWGFALVTKSLILTIASVMMTCLALLLDMRPKDLTHSD